MTNFYKKYRKRRFYNPLAPKVKNKFLLILLLIIMLCLGILLK